MEQSQTDQILDKLSTLSTSYEDLANHLKKQNGRVGKLERYTRMPDGYKGDGTDQTDIGHLVRYEMGETLRDFFSLKRIGSFLGVIVVTISIINNVLEWL